MKSHSEPRDRSNVRDPEARRWLESVLEHPAHLAHLLCDPDDDPCYPYGYGPAARTGQAWARTVPVGRTIELDKPSVHWYTSGYG